MGEIDETIIEPYKYEEDTRLKIGFWLSDEDRINFLDLNTDFFETFLKFLIRDFDDSWMENEEDEDNLEMRLIKYGKDIRNIHLSKTEDIEFHQYIIESCPMVTFVQIEECDINEILDMLHVRYSGQIKHLSLGSFHDEICELAQVPYFPKLISVQFKRVSIPFPYLKELLFFVPETLRCLKLKRLDKINEAIIKYIHDKFQDMEYLELFADEFTEDALMALNIPFLNLRELTISQVTSLSRQSLKFKLDPRNIPRLNTFTINGSPGISEENSRLPQMFSHKEYLLLNISFNYMNMNVDYHFSYDTFPTLRSIYLSYCNGITPENIAHMFEHQRLEELTIDDCQLTDQHFLPLIKRKRLFQNKNNLRYLSLKDNIHLGQNFVTLLINGLTKLVTLDITNTYDEKRPNISFSFDQIKKVNLSLGCIKIRNSIFDFSAVVKLLRISPELLELEVDDKDECVFYLTSEECYHSDLNIEEDLEL